MSGNNIPKIYSAEVNEIARQPISKEVTESTISFSFKFWKQIEYFGLDSSKLKWFVSLLDGLKSLNEINKSSLDEDLSLRSRFRYHVVNWNANKAPIAREDLDWLPKEILVNEDDFPIYQLSISTALGRIWGFWGGSGEETQFYIVLLDPEHNLQPSMNYNYKIDPCNYLENEYSDLSRRADNLVLNVLENCNECKAKEISSNFKNHKQERALISFDISDYNDVMEIIKDAKFPIDSLDDIVTFGIVQLYDNYP